MLAHLVPLLLMVLTILGSILGAAYVVWHFCADELDPKLLKRVNKGRRHSDQ